MFTFKEEESSKFDFKIVRDLFNLGKPNETNNIKFIKPLIKTKILNKIDQLVEYIGSELVNIIKDVINGIIKSPSINIQTPTTDSIWISILNGTWGTWNGYVISCYFHEEKKHYAKTTGKLGIKISWANKNEWAVSKQTRGLYGNKTNYGTI